VATNSLESWGTSLDRLTVSPLPSVLWLDGGTGSDPGADTSPKIRLQERCRTLWAEAEDGNVTGQEACPTEWGAPESAAGSAFRPILASERCCRTLDHSLEPGTTSIWIDGAGIAPGLSA
jgi:hypothetical protein